jgi:hypothetical protein
MFEKEEYENHNHAAATWYHARRVNNSDSECDKDNKMGHL